MFCFKCLTSRQKGMQGAEVMRKGPGFGKDAALRAIRISEREGQSEVHLPCLRPWHRNE